MFPLDAKSLPYLSLPPEDDVDDEDEDPSDEDRDEQGRLICPGGEFIYTSFLFLLVHLVVGGC